MSKKILYITNGISGSGGLERVVTLKASYFAKHYGYNAHIITLNEGEKAPFYPLDEKVTVHNITTHSNILQFYRDYYIGVKNYIHKIDPNVIFVADDGLKGVLFPLIFKPKCKIIYERHTTKAIHGGGVKAKLISKIMNYGSSQFNNFVVLTNRNKKDWPKANNLKVIPNPLPFQCQSVPPILSRNKIISVGSISNVKGHDILINAWKLIAQKYSNYTLHIYGEKKDNYENIVNLIYKNELENSVYIHEPTLNIKEKYLESIICVLPSRVEGFGMVLIEAMECGTPCIASNCEGPMDIIKNDCNGYLFEINNINELANRIEQLLSNNEILTNLSSNCCATASKYHIDSIMTKWDKLIN